MLHPLRTYATTPLVHPLLLQGGHNRDEAAGKVTYEMEICVNKKKKLQNLHHEKGLFDTHYRVCYQSETLLT